MLLLALSMVETAEEAAKLTRLYELYSTEMYHAAKNILRNHHDAEDAMQNAFVQLIRLLDHIKDPESPSTRAYVISAVQSRATDLYRYKQRRRAVSLDELEALSVPPAPPDVPGMSDIDRAIAMLPANYRRVNAAIRYTKRVALAALVSAVVIFSSLMTVASFRAKVVEVITEVFDTLTSYIFRPGEAESAPLSEVEFGWLPDNLQDVFTDETDEFRHLRFEFSDGKFISYSQLCLSDNTKTIGIEDSEYANFSTIELNGQIAKVTEKDGEYTLIWTSENNVLTLYTNFSYDILLDIAINIKFKY